MRYQSMIWNLILILVGLLSNPVVWAADLGRRKLADSFTYDNSGKIKVAFFDADSTLRVAPSGNVSANGGRDVWLLPQVTTEISRLNAEGYLVAIISNQGGVPKAVSLDQADEALDFVRKMTAWLNPKAVFHYYDFAENKDRDRKPETGMMERLEKTLQEKYGIGVQIDRQKSFMVGDSAYKKGQTWPDGTLGTDFSDSDRKVAENFGIKFVDPSEFFKWKQYGYLRFNKKSDVDDFFKLTPN